jgi:RNA polymerase-binding transcription factor DksA
MSPSSSRGHTFEAALARVKDEDFGFCQDCGVAIPLQRLVANPSATRCIGCQGQFEKTHAHHGHGSL